MTDAPDANDPPRAEPLLEDPRLPRPGGSLVAGRYDVLEVLGVGGYAVVYRARDERLGDEIALKVLDPYKSNRGHFVARFQQEVRVVRQLKHHNTIKVQDVGVTDDNCLFMAMEYVEGDTLADLIEKTGGLDPGRVVRIAAQILRSLDEAHALGVIHRDLKPNNVMVTQVRGEPDYVKVLDFGIAKALSPELSRVKTQTSEMMCTPGYAAPELLDGGEIGPQTDLYALGLMMIEMLTGKDVFAGSGLWAIVHKQLSSEPIPIPAEVRALPLGGVIERAIQKRMEDRYPDAHTMLAELLELGLYPRDMPTLTGQRRHYGDDSSPGGLAVTGAGTGAGRDRRPVAIAVIVASLLVIASSAAVIALRYLGATPVSGDDAGTDLGETDAGGGLVEGSDAGGQDTAAGSADAATGDGGERVAIVGAEACDGGDFRACLVAAATLAERSDAESWREARQGLLERACDGGFPAGCLALGRFLEEGTPDPDALAAAQQRYETACDSAEGEACLRAGEMLATGVGGQRNDVMAVALYRRACTYGVMNGCAKLGWMYLSGQGVQQSYELAHTYFQQACDGGGAQGCGLLGFAYHQGYGFGQNLDLARRYYTQACDGGDMTGCTGMGALYEEGEGVERDLDQARAFYERGCDGGSGPACHRLGLFYRDGNGVEADAERARAYFERGCEVGFAQACAELE